MSEFKQVTNLNSWAAQLIVGGQQGDNLPRPNLSRLESHFIILANWEAKPNVTLF
jgi:hypothetical protein